MPACVIVRYALVFVLLLCACGDDIVVVGAATPNRFEPSVMDFGARPTRVVASLDGLLHHPGVDGFVLDVTFATDEGAFALRTEGRTLLGSTLRPSGRTPIQVLFVPRRAGPHEAAVSVAVGDSSVEMVLRGEGYEVSLPELRSTPERIEFTKTPIGAVHTAGLRLDNLADVSTQVRLAAADDSPFMVRLHGAEFGAAAIDPQQSLMLEVDFRPTAAGEYERTLRFQLITGELLTVPVYGVAALE